MTKKKKSCKSCDLQDSVAEREGFEPPVPLSTPVFKTGAFDHSAISPYLKNLLSVLKRVQRYGIIFISANFIATFFIKKDVFANFAP